METLRKYLDWRAILIAWIAAATTFLVANLILMPLLLDVGPVLFLQYLASLAFGPDVLIEATALQLIVGVLIHYALSLVFTIIIAVVVHRWGLLVGLVGGAILGLAFYGINMYTMTVFFEWFFALNGTWLLIGHILFGLVAGGVYETFDRYDEPYFEEERRDAA